MKLLEIASLALVLASASAYADTSALTRHEGWKLMDKAPNSATCPTNLGIVAGTAFSEGYFINFVEPTFSVQEFWQLGTNKDSAAKEITVGTEGNQSITLSIYKEHLFGKKLDEVKSLKVIGNNLDQLELRITGEQVDEYCTFSPYSEK